MTVIPVTLGPDEIAVAKLVGTRRFQASRNAGSADVHFPHDSSSEETDHHAAGAEVAACKALGGWWSAISSVGSDNRFADITVRGRPGQVRHSVYPNAFLPIYPEDNPMLPFVFVTGKLPNYMVVGWILGRSAQTQERWSTTNPRTGQPLKCPAYIVEQHELRDFGAMAQVAA